MVSNLKLEKEKYLLTDGRVISYIEYGDPDGIPVFYAHGCPSSCIESQIFHDEAVRTKFRLIATDRPGMGESSFHKGREVLDYARDIEELANGLEITEFGVLGWSGGGAFTTACSYYFSDRLLFNIVLAGYTNFNELPKSETYLISKLDQLSINLSIKYPVLFKLMFISMNYFQRIMPNTFYRFFVQSLCRSDKEIASDEVFRMMLINSLSGAFSQNSNGGTVDALLNYSDWGFNIKDIKNRLNIFHGSEDTLVPVKFSEHIKENSNDCTLHLLEGYGHFFPFKYQKEIFAVATLELQKKRLN